MLFDTLPRSDHERFELRTIVEADLAPWYDYLSIPLVHEHTSWDVSSPADLAHYVDANVAATPDSALRLALVEHATGVLAGTIGFHSVSPRDRRAELAYDLAPPFWGQGVATAMAASMVEWAHAHAGIVRVQATVMRSNVRSMAVLGRCGFEREGCLRSYRMVRGVPGDFDVYAHLAGDPARPP